MIEKFCLPILCTLSALTLGCSPAALPPTTLATPAGAEVRPIVASDVLQGRWNIIAVNGKKVSGPWLDLGGEGLGTLTRAETGGLLVRSPQPLTQAFLGCNNWRLNGWTRNGDKLILGTEMSAKTERGCDPATMAVEQEAYAIMRESMTMEFTPPGILRFVNEKGTVDLIRQGS